MHVQALLIIIIASKSSLVLARVASALMLLDHSTFRLTRDHIIQFIMMSALRIILSGLGMLMSLKAVSCYPTFLPIVSSPTEAFVITSTATESPSNFLTAPKIPVKRQENSSRFHIISDIKYRYCRTLIERIVTNEDAHKSLETNFHFVLPETAFISKFIM